MNSQRTRIRTSRSGKILILLGVFLLLAAQNTGNNLLYLMSSCFFSCLLWGAFASWRNISGLKIELIFPDYYFAGEQDAIRCRIEDVAGRPRFFLGFEEDFAELLPAGQFIMLKADLQTSQRGCYRVNGFRVFSSYPVDLFISTCELASSELLVGPKLSSRTPEVFNREEGGVIDQLTSGKEGDYWMQKPYQEGEDATLINWSISARSFTEWVLIKSVKYGLNRRLCFDFSGVDAEMFENCLEVVAGLVIRLRRHDIDAFVWGKGETGSYQWLSVISDLPALAAWLARLQPDSFALPEDSDVEMLKFADLYRSVPL